MKILLDAGIFIHAEFAAPTTRVQTVKWGPTNQSVNVAGFVRKPLDDDPAVQKQKDALFTVGRLIREGRIQAYRYDEISLELWRAANPMIVNALAGCEIHHCNPPLFRSKFRSTINFEEVARKGGRKDRKAGLKPSEFNQIPWMRWLTDLKPEEVDMLSIHAGDIGLTPFEVESLTGLNWFKVMCDRSSSAENYVDVFHLWTAERNGFGFLTLDFGPKRLVERVSLEKKCPVAVRSRVYLPSDLLYELGVTQADSVPIQSGHFYPAGLPI